MKRIAHNTINRDGQTINHWLIVKYSHTDKHKKRHYLCRCVCGHEITKRLSEVLYGKSFSCGCKNAENHVTHGKSNDKVYNSWQNMKNRCLNEKATQYKWYGARGITVCAQWINSFEYFLKDMGLPPTDKHTIDRINNNGNYEPSNCKWSTKSEQASNRSKHLLSRPTNIKH